MVKHLSLLPVLIIIALSSCKKSEATYTLANNVVQIEADGGTYSISAVHDDIIRIGFSDSITYGDKVYGPIISESLPLSIGESHNTLSLTTANVEVKITLSPFHIEFKDKNGTTKLSESEGFSRTGDTTSFSFLLKDGERIYGTGGRALPLNRWGYDFLSYNRPQYGYGWGEESLNYSLPHLMSSENYMLLIDNPARGIFDIGKKKDDVLEFKSAGGNMTYYFINGGHFEALMKNLVVLTGTQPLPPIWAFGHLQSRFGYRTQAETERILDQALKAGYPVDAVIIDIYWFGPELEDGKMGQLSWDKNRWPDPKGMIQRFKEKGVKTITVSEPFFTRKSKHYPYLSENKLLALDKDGNTMDIGDFYFGVGGLLDIFKPEAKAWMWQQYKDIKSYGVEGLWVDLAEPEKHPDSMIHVNGPAPLIHGIFGHEWAKMLYEGYAQDYPDERLFHMGRAGYIGTQRYGLLPWTGDVGRNWSGFKPQTSMMLSMGLSGIGYMHSDAGGFSVGEADPELYTRWMQFSSFTPIFRPHGDESIPAEPVLWPQNVQKNVKPFIELRYKMLPYNYTTAWQNSTTGIPLARPLFTTYPEIPDTILHQYMWGDNLMVCPVLYPGMKEMVVSVPSGKWYNFWNNEAVSSGTNTIPLSMDNIPVYAKGGGFLTMTPLVSSTDDYHSDQLNCTYYLDDTNSSGTVYFDDGRTPRAFDKGLYHLVSLKAFPSDDVLLINTSLTGSGYNGAPQSRKTRMVVIGLNKAPVSVIAGEELDFKWEETTKKLSFDIDLNVENHITVNR
jgi:alpha-glucosidase (family GH31 glycosyl hydrolase)